MQNRTLYVGNIVYTANESDLDCVFSEYGKVDDIRLMMDRETGRSRGFAFVTFADEEEAKKAMEKNGQEFLGRELRVNIAREKNE